MDPNEILQPFQPACYRFRLQGYTSADWTDWLIDPKEDVDSDGAGTITTITGTVRDQAALFGLLSFIRDLYLPLISVEYIAKRSLS
jgi:hypothetical protein